MVCPVIIVQRQVRGRLFLFSISLVFAAVLFAFSTMIAWSYYGLQGWSYLFGKDPKTQKAYKFIFCVFVALICMVRLGPLLDISDAFVFLICVPNILGMYFLALIVYVNWTITPRA